ncbi:MAG: YceI family protein [Bacteroidota bacterium]|jgi:hypothetical protein
MKKLLLSAALVLAAFGISKAQIYMSKSCEISFFSSAPLENITAVDKTTKPLLNAANGQVLFKMTIKGFMFEKELMREHFNENYMESDKYPYAEFKGNINEKIDYTKDGTYDVTVTGKLTIHGVEKERTIKGKLTVKGKEVSIDCKFNVALKDHNITVPELMFQKIAESVEVTVKATLVQKEK